MSLVLIAQDRSVFGVMIFFDKEEFKPDAWVGPGSMKNLKRHHQIVFQVDRYMVGHYGSVGSRK